MTIFVRTRATVDGEERDLLVEVRKMDIMADDGGRTVVLVDDFSMFSSPGVELMPVIFVNGCFWHWHPDPNCPIAGSPKTNLEYWEPRCWLVRWV